MNLTSILLIATAVLVASTGLITWDGASKADRGRMTWFFVSTIGTMVWSLSIAGFLGAPETISDGGIKTVIYGIYLAPLIAVPTILGYGAWKFKTGKIITVLFLILAAILGTVWVQSPELWMESLTLSAVNGNSLTIVKGWAYVIYTLFFTACFVACIVTLFYRVKHTKNKRVRVGDKIFAFAMLGASGFIGLFDVILPYLGNYQLIWVGPIAMTVVTLLFFYSVLKYRIVSVEVRWMKIMAYAVVMTSGVIVYMLLFYIIFTVLFKIPNPSTSVLVLNFLMIVIVLLLMPVINELIVAVKSMIMVGQVDIAYVVRKLNHLASKNVDLRDLAGFLADHLHFAYVGFIINGHLYGSKPLAMTANEIKQISGMKSARGGNVWQEPSKSAKEVLDELDLKAVAELRNAKGKAFGQLVVGKPLGKSSFERRDLIQLEMIINLVATVIDSEKHIRA